MAIVNSLAVGKATKTAGELTYAKVRGRTIARRRIISNKSNTAKQEAQRFTFGVVSSMAAILDPYIKQNFAPTEYGSARNCFIKKNWPFLKGGYSTDAPSEMTMFSVLYDIINSGGFVQYGEGYEGSMAITRVNEATLNVSAEIIDKNYKTVEAYVSSASSQSVSFRRLGTQPTLRNGVWTLNLPEVTASADLSFFILLLYVDGKPINNNTGVYIKQEEGDV